MYLITYAIGDSYKEAQKIANEVKFKLRDLGHLAHLVEDIDVPDFTPTMVIAVGGDGTIMRAMKKYSAYGIPTFGINAGSLGFLAAAERSNWKSALKRLVANKYEIEQRLALEFMWRDQVFGPLVNEVFLKHVRYPVSYKASINDVVMWKNLEARGLMLATATGSNAENFSNGGYSLFPTSDDVILTPMNSQKVNVGPFSFPELSKGGQVVIELLPGKYGDMSVEVWGDGEQFTIDDEDLTPGESILVRASTQPLLLVTAGLQQHIKALKGKKGYSA